jgi:hypothetical protein
MPSPSHVPALHGMPATNFRHAPAPSQAPSWPQVAGVLALQKLESAGFTPAGTKLQSPSELGRLQALQPSVQAEVQHTPLAQNPLLQSLSQMQASALPLLAAWASLMQVTTPPISGRSAAGPSSRLTMSWPAELESPTAPSRTTTGADFLQPVASTPSKIAPATNSIPQEPARKRMVNP